MMNEIIEAAEEGDQAEVVRLLNATPALQTGKDRQKNRVLTVAAEHGHLGLVVLLVERAAGVNDTGRCDRTALHWASFGGHEEVVAYLLGREAKVDTSDMFGMTPLISACGEGHLGVVRMLAQHLEEVGLDGRDDDGMEPLHYAAKFGHEDVVTFLLGKGAPADNMSNKGKTPFMLASRGGHAGVAQLLLEHVGEGGLNEPDIAGKTAIHFAAEEGHVPMVTFLLGKGMGPSSVDNDVRTPLMLAAAKGHMGVVQTLVQHTGGRGLDEQDLDDCTAMHYAVSKNRADVVRFLLVSRADPTVEDTEGYTPREHATSLYHMECIKVFDWWQRELESRAVIYRATSLHKASVMQQDISTSQVPTYLKARVAAGHALPSVEVVVPPPQEQEETEEEKGPLYERAMFIRNFKAKRKAAEESNEDRAPVGEEERHAVVEYVVKVMNEELITELLEGFHSE